VALYKERGEPIRRLIRQTAAQTDRPFGINLIPEVSGHAAEREQLLAALSELPRSGFVTTSGLQDRDFADLVRRAQRCQVVQIGTPDDATAALEIGAGALVLQGSEAGGHHLGRIASRDLLSEVRTRHAQAVLAVAGGIATGIDLAAAIVAGADGAIAGTAFIPAHESRAHPDLKARVLSADADDTVITSASTSAGPTVGIGCFGTPRPRQAIANRLISSRRPWWKVVGYPCPGTAQRCPLLVLKADRSDG